MDSGDFDQELEEIFEKEQTQAQHERPDDEPLPDERDLQKLLMEGGLDLRSKWGLRYSRASDGGKSSEYKGNRLDKKKFREDWVKAQLSKVMQERLRMTKYKTVNFKRGVYRPFSILYKNQGGKDDPGAMRAALNIARSCIRLGGDWTKYNRMSKRLEFFELQSGWEQDLTEAWALYEKRYQNAGGDVGTSKDDGGGVGIAKDDQKMQNDDQGSELSGAEGLG